MTRRGGERKERKRKDVEMGEGKMKRKNERARKEGRYWLQI